MKRIIIAMVLLFAMSLPAFALEPVPEEAIAVTAPSAVLMESVSGDTIYEKNAHEHRAPASVTKVMTLLLIMEEIAAERLTQEDMITCSSYAASMGGSQIWLEEGEQMRAGDMIKAVTVVSANDCAVALAEHIAGSETAFVARMNARAVELGMVDTNFVDCTGLTDDDNHYTCAYDIALMSRMLIKHAEIKEYTTIWMDELRDGKSGLTNTNRLVRFYPGATGLKTGFTRKAMYCLSATAERDGVEYIAVVMHEETSDQRFESAKSLLNYAFANYTLCSLRAPEAVAPVRVRLGIADSVQPVYLGEEGMLVEKTALTELRYEFELLESVDAPVAQGDSLGEMVVYSGENELARVQLVAGNEVAKLTLFKVYGNLLLRLFGG